MDPVVGDAKAPGPAAMATIATALQLLQSATSVPVCPPTIAPVCSIALQVIQKTQETQQNQQTCSELAEKISQIMIVVLKSSSNQQTPNMPENIERLRRDLADLSKKLQKVLGKNGFKKWVLSSHYKQEITSFSTKLDWAVNFFKLETLLHIKEKIDIMHSNSSVPLAAGISEQVLGLPPKPEIFYGRDGVVEDLVRRLVSTPNGRFSIGGPSGLGKTSVALTAMHDPRVAAKFEDRRYWVPCDQTNSTSSLIQLLAETVKIPTSSTSLLEKVLMQLDCNNTPKIVLLDNFETPWDLEDHRQGIETVLKHIVSVPSVTLLITVRSERPPCNGVDWTLPVMKPLDTLTVDAARQLYKRKHPDAAENATLDTLLYELSYMPLAVTLMASRGAFGETPEELLSRWRSIGTATLGQSGSRLDSVQVSIRLSTESRTMKSNPDALELLSLLTLLPAGVPKDFLPRIAPDIHVAEALLVLRRVSLAYFNSESKRVCLLSPIRQFVSEFHPPTEQKLVTIFQVYRAFVLAAANGMDPEHSQFHISRALITHFPNVEAVILKCLSTSNPNDAIDFAIEICSWRDSPMNLRLIQAALSAVGQKDDRVLKARCNHALAIATIWTDLPKAITIMKDALDAFRDLKNQQYTLRCLSSLAELLYLDKRHRESTSYAEQAADLARSLDDDAYYAESLRVLARIDMDQGRFEDALVMMEEVHWMQQGTSHLKGDKSVIASLLIYASLLGRCGQFKEALDKLGEAQIKIQELFDQTYYEGWRQRALGDLYRQQNRIDDALTAYSASASEKRKGGFVEDVLWRQADIGAMLALQGKCDHADSLFERTLGEAQAGGFWKISDYCTKQLGRA